MNPESKLIVGDSVQLSEWPSAVHEAFLRLVETATEHDFNILCAVGLNMKAARAGQTRLSAELSPNASCNPHRAELCADISEMFRRMSERSKQ